MTTMILQAIINPGKIRPEFPHSSLHYAEICVEDSTLFFLYYYDVDKRMLADYCLFSIEEAKEQAFFDCGLEDMDWIEVNC